MKIGQKVVFTQNYKKLYNYRKDLNEVFTVVEVNEVKNTTEKLFFIKLNTDLTVNSGFLQKI